jgi:GNAT superfamily N-acetyltransferase
MLQRSFDIRPACPEDLDRLTELLKVLFSVEEDFTFNQTLQQRGLQLMLENDRGCILVAEVDGQVIGMCTGQLTISTAEGRQALLVEDVVVDASFLGQGVGRSLMEAIGAWAKKQGASRLQLLADRNNAPALEFYKRLGWQSTALICLRKYEL